MTQIFFSETKQYLSCSEGSIRIGKVKESLLWSKVVESYFYLLQNPFYEFENLKWQWFQCRKEQIWVFENLWNLIFGEG